MEKAMRVISVERGHDPRDFTLVAFGGAGGLHACELARALEIPRVLVPCFPGGLSALGILRADVTKDLSRTIHRKVQSTREAGVHLHRAFAVLKSEGLRQMHGEGYLGSSVQVHFSIDMRYAGQSYELNVPFAGDFMAAFHRAHEKRYGYSDRTRGCEVVNVRARFTGHTPKPDLPVWKSGGRSAAAAIISKASTHLRGRRRVTNLYDRSRLRAGNRIAGPAIVTEYSATTFLPPEWLGQVDRNGNLILEPRR
jgi:N-methylhydantoinase A